MKIIAFVGAPASGKTEAANVARELGIPVISMGDVIREELRRRGLPLTDENAVSYTHLTLPTKRIV